MPNIELSKDIVGVSIGTGVGKLSTVPSADSLPTVSTPDSSNSGTQSSSTPASGSAGSISAPNQLGNNNRIRSFLSPSPNKQGSTTSQLLASRMQHFGSSPSGSPRSSTSGMSGSGDAAVSGSVGGGSEIATDDNKSTLEGQWRDKKASIKSSIAFNLSIDVCRLPRVLCLPFTTDTVRAFTEFLYTGQVGSNWKIVPTASEVMLVAKFYEVPLLYDLILEVLFAVISKKEAQLIKDAQSLKKQFIEHGIKFNQESRFDDGVSELPKLQLDLLDR
ncbi:unnamed protein product [Ambrosiozyma monospora]|uniref:Unnamed protein product n=1 Tax=Ambrosiozyma monospora TaxID=43982 RepID=A0ACB5UA35_AMBMO|nr:unnamed protein product [Ambrosiozyma monospora]